MRLTLDPTCLHRRKRRIVACKVARVDLERGQGARRGKLYDAMVVTLVTSPPRLPAVHPFTVLVIDACPPLRLGRLQHPFLGGEEIVAGEQRDRAEPLVSNIDVALQ